MRREQEDRRSRRERLIQQRSFRIYKKATLVFLGLILAAGVCLIFQKDKAYSETENRMLAQKPEFSLANLASGQFMQDMESYVTDQFFIRDKWINLKMLQDLTLGKRESNGVYIGDDKQLIEIPDEPNQESLQENLQAICSFAERHSTVNTVMTLVPNAAWICDDKLPAFAPVRDQAADIAQVKQEVESTLHFVDLTETLYAHKQEELYYKTDHHWTSLAARYAFEAMQEQLNISGPTQEYKIYPVTHSFSGTLASKSGYDRGRDTVEIYVPQGVSNDCVVTYVDEQRKSSSIYESAALEQKDKYEVFFGGNYTRVDIETPNPEKRNLLLFKDSYANCFVQFLIPYYRKIIMIDPRYYSDDIEKLVEDNEITDMLFLYNVNTFMTDNSIADVLTEE